MKSQKMTNFVQKTQKIALTYIDYLYIIKK